MRRECFWSWPLQNAHIYRSGAVAGPAGAYVASAHRLGWKTPSWCHILRDDDTMVNLMDVAPRDLKALAFRSWQRKEARRKTKRRG